jgi:hypothetical protein
MWFLTSAHCTLLLFLKFEKKECLLDSVGDCLMKVLMMFVFND